MKHLCAICGTVVIIPKIGPLDININPGDRIVCSWGCLEQLTQEENTMTDKNVTWDPENPDDVDRAKQDYTALAAAGFTIVQGGKPVDGFEGKAGHFLATREWKPEAEAEEEEAEKVNPDQQIEP